MATAAPSSGEDVVLYSRPFDPSVTDELDRFRACKLVHIPDFKDIPSELAPRVIGLLVHGHTIVDGAFMDRFPRLRCISNHGVGVDHINIPDATSRGIPVGNTPDVLNGATADVALALLLAAARRVVPGDALSRAPGTLSFASFPFGSEVHGATVGIIGMGRIGQAIAKRAHAGFDMRVHYHNRSRASGEVEAAYGATYHAAVESMLPLCDFIVLCAPATAETRHMMNAARFSLMKRSAIFVNVARGSLVDQDALVHALNSGGIAGAGLDVTDPEPLPRDHPLLSCPNCTITPHVGSATFSTRRNMLKLAVQNLEAGVTGTAMKACVNPSVPPKL